MGMTSPLHLIVLALVAVVVLGGGRFSNMMGDVAKGVKNFKKGMAEEDEETVRKSPSRIEVKTTEPALDRDADRVREDR